MSSAERVLNSETLICEVHRSIVRHWHFDSILDRELLTVLAQFIMHRDGHPSPLTCRWSTVIDRSRFRPSPNLATPKAWVHLRETTEAIHWNTLKHRLRAFRLAAGRMVEPPLSGRIQGHRSTQICVIEDVYSISSTPEPQSVNPCQWFAISNNWQSMDICYWSAGNVNEVPSNVRTDWSLWDATEMTVLVGPTEQRMDLVRFTPFRIQDHGQEFSLFMAPLFRRRLQYQSNNHDLHCSLLHFFVCLPCLQFQNHYANDALYEGK